jgi:hypothetical protein
VEREKARREDAMEFRLGWKLEDVDEYRATATALELKEMEEVIEDAVLAGLEDEYDACRVLTYDAYSVASSR